MRHSFASELVSSGASPLAFRGNGLYGAAARCPPVYRPVSRGTRCREAAPATAGRERGIDPAPAIAPASALQPRPARSDPRPVSGARALNERNLDHPICLGPWLRVIKNARLTASM